MDSICRNSYQNHFCCCIRRLDARTHYQLIKQCAFFELNLKTKYTGSEIYGLGVVSFMGDPVRWSKSKKWRRPVGPDVNVLAMSMENDGSYFLPDKVATSKFESICESDKNLIRHQQEDFDCVSIQQISPPWGGFTNKKLEDHFPSDKASTICESTWDTSVDKFQYLEERNEEVLSGRIIKLSRLNKVKSVLALFRSIEFCGLSPNLHACNSLLSCLLRNKRLHDALKIFEYMKTNEIVSGHSYSLILKGVACLRSCDAAFAMFEEAEQNARAKKYLDVVVYNTMIAAFARVNDWVQAERMWRSLQNSKHAETVVTYRLLICLFVRSHQNELALDAYHAMVQNGLNPCNDVLEAVIGACTREGKWEMALNVFHNIANTGLKPSLTSCNAVINSLSKAGMVELAFKVYDQMILFGHVPDAYTWNSLLNALYRANQPADALRLFENIRKDDKCVLNLHLYNTCLMCCRRLGLWDRAMQLLWQMETAGLAVSVTSYNLVIGACEAARKPEIALRVYEHMVDLRVSPDTFTHLSLIRSCIWGSLWSKVEEILESTPNGSHYNAAIQGMCLRNQPDMARTLYTKMRKIGLEPDGKTRALMLQNLPRS